MTCQWRNPDGGRLKAENNLPIEQIIIMRMLRLRPWLDGRYRTVPVWAGKGKRNNTTYRGARRNFNRALDWWGLRNERREHGFSRSEQDRMRMNRAGQYATE